MSIALNVLVVDDSAVMRSMVIKSLRLCGVPVGEVHEASNGREGLQVLDENWVDLLLVDLNMPVMTGAEMIEAVRGRQDTSSMPILVISTEGSETRIREIHRHGAGFIHKPFAPEDLGRTIREMTGVSDEQYDDGSLDSGGDADF